MLTDGIITLRALEITDVDTLYDWENDPSLWSVGVTLAPYSRHQLWEYVNNYDGDIYAAKQLRLMIDIAGNRSPIGTLDFYDFDAANSRCGVGILVAKPYQRLGYGLRALKLGEDYCRKRLSLHQLYCIVGKDNTPSRALFTKAGYKISGHLQSWLKSAGAYSDAYIYQRFL